VADTQLTGLEWEQLRQLSLGVVHRDISKATLQKLVAAGYATEDEDGRVELTPLGEAAVERHFARS
jgi:Mn-dependent DtxR family transcriptional regulator